MILRLFSVVLLVSASLFSTAVFANTPKDVSDLVGARASSGESELRSRGFVHIDTEKGSDRSWSYWWNPSRQECVTVATVNGRYDSITATPSSDCNQHHASGSAESDKNSAGAAAAAIGIAALIGAVAVAHKSNHHEDGKHHNTASHEKEFERGYNDGLYDEHFDNYNDSDGYAEGFNSGVQQRKHDTSYRHHSGKSQNNYYGPVEFTDLNGAKASSADSTLQKRGFDNVDGFKESSVAYTVWYNRRSGQCLQMATENGRVADISDIGYNAACR